MCEHMHVAFRLHGSRHEVWSSDEASTQDALVDQPALVTQPTCNWNACVADSIRWLPLGSSWGSSVASLSVASERGNAGDQM